MAEEDSETPNLGQPGDDEEEQEEDAGKGGKKRGLA